MKPKKTEKSEHEINEQFPFADTPEGRRKLYERAVQFSERFIYYSPDPTVEDEPIVKVTRWDDENGKRHNEYHETTAEENAAREIAFEITRIYESHHSIDVFLNITGKHYLSDADFEQAVKEMNTLICDREPSRLLANEHGESKNKQPEERNNTGLSNEQISVLRDISAIREAKQEPEYDRVAAFGQQEQSSNSFSLDDPFKKEGDQVYEQPEPSESRTPYRILRFKEGSSIKFITYNDMVKETSIQSPGRPNQTISEPITVEEKKSLDEMFESIEAYEDGMYIEPEIDDDMELER